MGTYNDLTGKRFDRLLAVGRAPNVGLRTYWDCICDCGTKKSIAAQPLSSGITRSCGCLRRERVSEGKRKAPGVSGLQSLFTSYKKRATENGREFSLSLEEFGELTKRNCSYCDSPPSSVRTLNKWKGRQVEAAVRAQQHSAYTYNGLDRLDSSKGYTPSNSVPCCTRCNRAKNDMSIVEFRQHIIKMYTFMFQQ